MCCSHLSVKGGMVSVVKNYLNYPKWDDINIVYVPTHIEKNKIFLLFHFALAFIKIIFLTGSGKIKIAHLHVAERGSFFRKAILARYLQKRGVKVILHHHGAEFELFYSSLSEKKKTFVSSILTEVDLNIVLSQKLITMITTKAPQAKVEVLYNAVNTPSQNPYNKDSKTVLFLGRLGERKGAYDLLKVIKMLDNEIDKEVKFAMCGDGEIAQIKQYITEHSLQHRIEHVGWIDGEQKKKILANTMLNVLPSYNEGLPMTILETMAAGIPNVSTNIASIPEVIINGENGFLIEPGDIEALYKSIKLVVNSLELRKEFSKKSFETISANFSLENNITHIKRIYNTL